MKTVISFCTSFRSKSSFIDSKQSKAGAPSKSHPCSQGRADVQKRLHSRLRAADEILAMLYSFPTTEQSLEIFKYLKKPQQNSRAAHFICWNIDLRRQKIPSKFMFLCNIPAEQRFKV